MMNYYEALQSRDCLTWCYVFVPYFGDTRFILVLSLIGILLTVFSCHGIVAFTFGMGNLVFWTLTCFQCPFPCRSYQAMCDPDNSRCQDTLLLWTWPAISLSSVIFSLLLHIFANGRIGIHPKCRDCRSECPNVREIVQETFSIKHDEYAFHLDNTTQPSFINLSDSFGPDRSLSLDYL